jgi:hypothetical protein
VLLATVELHQQTVVRITNLEEGRIEPVQQVEVLGDREHVVGHLQESTQLPNERGRALAAPQERLQGFPPDTPLLADLQTRQDPLPTPAPDGGLLDPYQPGDVLRA